MDEIEIVELPAQAVLGLRRRGPYAEIPEMLMEVFAVIMEKGAIPAGPPVFVCRETVMAEVGRAVAAGDADLEVAFPVANRVKPEGDVAYYELPGGRFARSSTAVRTSGVPRPTSGSMPGSPNGGWRSQGRSASITSTTPRRSRPRRS